ncbi:Guanine nucleotide-binding protein-like 3, partial [Quaeritorhiza haematococci]
IKRSVQAKFNTEVNFISAQLLASRQAGAPDASATSATPIPNSMAALEAQAEAEDRAAAEEAAAARANSGTRVVGFVRAEVTEKKASVPDTSATSAAAANPDEIEIGDDDSDEDEEGTGSGGEEEEDEEKKMEVEGVARRSVPDAVFGGLAEVVKGKTEGTEELGAKERFKRKRDGVGGRPEITSDGGKDKRLSASKRYKIERKVAEHRRKLRKEAKKGNLPGKNKLKKDPGIPNLFPLKEKILHEIQDAKQKAELEKQQKRAEAKALKALKLKGGDSKLAALAQDAARRGDAFDASAAQHNAANGAYADYTASVDGVKDNSMKAYYKEFRKVVEAADVILEVLDARDPLGCRPKAVEEMILNSGINKRIILVLNKIDLVPREVVEQWLKYLRNEFPTVAFKASTQSQRSNLGQSSVNPNLATESLLNSSECLGADTLIQLLKNYCRNAHIKTSISVGVVGFPNVGKSSVINSLKRSRVCGVGSTPGLTKSTQEIALDKNIKLLDCPGIVFGKALSNQDQAEVALRNCVKVELLSDPISPVELILSRCNREQLMLLYNIPYFQTVNDFLIHIARIRGRLKKGGVPDLENAARVVLRDWNAGRIAFYTVPPTDSGVAVTSHVASSVVQAWSQEFELPQIVEVEGKQVLSNVKKLSDMGGKLLKMNESAATVDVDMDAQVDEEDEDEEDEDVMDDDEDDEDDDEEAMEDDEDDEHDDGEEIMEDDTASIAASTSASRYIFAPVPKASKKSSSNTSDPKGKGKAKSKDSTTPADDYMNVAQMVPAGKRKQLKKQKKKESRVGGSSMMDDDDDFPVGGAVPMRRGKTSGGDAYDFSEYFG